MNSLHNMEALNKAYLITTHKSPEKIMSSSRKHKTQDTYDLNSMGLRESIEMQK